MPPRSAVFAAIRKSIDADEVLLTLGLALITWGLWPLVGVCALIVPGAVLLWLALPSRAPFVTPPAEKPARRTD